MHQAKVKIPSGEIVFLAGGQPVQGSAEIYDLDSSASECLDPEDYSAGDGIGMVGMFRV